MKEFYVSPFGNDNGAGSKNYPFLTINKGVSALQDGDKLFLMDGVYSDVGEVNVTASNVVIAADEGARPVWDARESWPKLNNPDRSSKSNNSIYEAFIKAQGETGIVIRGIEFKNGNGRGVYLYDCNKVEVRECTFENIGRQAISVVQCQDDCVISDNTINGAIQVGTNGAAFQIKESSGVVCERNEVRFSGRDGMIITICDDIVFRDNVVSDIKLYGIYLERASRCVIDRNLVYSTDETPTSILMFVTQEWDDKKTKDILVSNNICVGPNHNISFGYNLGTNGGKFIPSAGVDALDICNNTFCGGEVATTKFAVNFDTPVSNHSPSRFSNNIVVPKDGARGAIVAADAVAKMTFGWNAWGDVPPAKISNKLEQSDLVSGWDAQKDITDCLAPIPTFKDISVDNYKLTTESALIDAGSDVSTVSEDYLGNARLGGSFDIGAIEHIRQESNSFDVSGRVVDGVFVLVDLREDFIKGARTVGGWFTGENGELLLLEVSEDIPGEEIDGDN